MEEKDVSEVDWTSASGALDPWDGSPLLDWGIDQKPMETPCEMAGSKGEVNEDKGTDTPELLTRAPSLASPLWPRLNY